MSTKNMPVGARGKRTMFEHLLRAVDGKSLVLMGASIPTLFVGNGWMPYLGYVAALTTILYNGIRIYKELRKQPKQKP